MFSSILLISFKNITIQIQTTWQCHLSHDLSYHHLTYHMTLDVSNKTDYPNVLKYWDT